jgi:hypothetical protein
MEHGEQSNIWTVIEEEEKGFSKIAKIIATDSKISTKPK